MTPITPSITTPEKDIKEEYIDHVIAEDLVKGEMAAGHEEVEKTLTLWQNLQLYKKAVLWSVVMSASLIMEGYDKALIGNFWAHPAFSERYGVLVPSTGTYTVEAPWQTAISQAATIGSFFGLIIGGWQVDRYGYRSVMIINMALMIPFILIVMLAPNKIALFIGQLLCGFPWGVFAALAPSYASEICPIGLRGYLTTYVNLCWVMGQFIAAGTVFGTSTWASEWAYRLPFALQLIWPVVLIPLFWFAPESPWWYVRKDRLEDAQKSVQRLANPSLDNDAVAAVAAMVRTNKLEVEAAQGHNPRWIDCFRGIDLRRTEISALAWSAQVLSGGSYTIGYCTYFFRQAGLNVADSFKFGLGVTAAALVGTLTSWILIHHFGRRAIFVGGLFSLASIHFIIGGLAIASATGNSGARWGQAGLTMVWVFLYDFSVGPLAYAIIGETSSTRLRAKTIAISRNAYYLCVIFSNIITPYMLNPTAWDLQGKSNFVWAPIAVIMAVWGYYRLPEMKGRSFYELDVMFENHVPARQFQHTIVETIADGRAEVHRKAK